MLKALSRVSTSTTVLYGSVEKVVADSTGHPPFVMSCSYTKPKDLDDKVAKSHLLAFEMSCPFTVKVQAQLDLLWILTKTKTYKKTISSSCQKRSTRKWRKLHFPALSANFRRFLVRAAFGARRPTVLRRRGLLPESSRTGARWPTVLRHRGLLPL